MGRLVWPPLSENVPVASRGYRATLFRSAIRSTFTPLASRAPAASATCASETRATPTQRSATTLQQALLLNHASVESASHASLARANESTKSGCKTPRQPNRCRVPSTSRSHLAKAPMTQQSNVPPSCNACSTQEELDQVERILERKKKSNQNKKNNNNNNNNNNNFCVCRRL